MVGSCLVSVHWDKPDEDLDWKTISYLGSLKIQAKEDTFEHVLCFVQQRAREFKIYCDCRALSTSDQIIELLNAGCVKVFLSQSLLHTLFEDKAFSLDYVDRLVLYIDSDLPDDVEKSIDDYSQRSKAQLSFAGNLRQCESLQAKAKNAHLYRELYAVLVDPLAEGAVNLLKRDLNVILASSRLCVHYPSDGRLELHRLITDIAQSDRPDGLIPTVVADERGVSLGLVYSSRESIAKAIELGRGVYYSRSRKGLWIKGEESGNTQQLLGISLDCDADSLQFRVRQRGEGFCHLQTATCFGPVSGIAKLERTLHDRKQSAPAGSYSARLFNDPNLLKAKIMEEASELCNAASQQNAADEAADLLYFSLVKCITAGIQVADIEKSLDQKSLRVTRRKGDAKIAWVDNAEPPHTTNSVTETVHSYSKNTKDIPAQRSPIEPNAATATSQNGIAARNEIRMKRYETAKTPESVLQHVLQRPSQRSTDEIIDVVKPIINDIRDGGDKELLRYTHKFEKAVSLTSPVIKAPFPQHLMQLPQETIEAIDISFNNIRRFHAAQKEERPLEVETMPGVVCSRFSRAIERVGLYVPGGTAVLPSTALMLGVPAMVAGCKTIVLASPPRMSGAISPEIVYIAHKIGAESIVLAGGAQAIAALAYGTESVSKVDKILGPGNQFVTAGKMIVSNDTNAGISIDMPAGPSEVLVVADKTANPAYVASDLLSQAEHGVDSQVILIAVALGEEELAAIEAELQAQASTLPRFDIVKAAIGHSVTLSVSNIDEAMRYSNAYAPEHLILQVQHAEDVVRMVQNAGSVFVGPWTPESVGDYSAGTNHSLPTYGYAKQYSGVNLSSFTKHITCSNLTKDGLRNVGNSVMQLAKVEELEAHRRAVSIRLGLSN